MDVWTYLFFGLPFLVALWCAVGELRAIAGALIALREEDE